MQYAKGRVLSDRLGLNQWFVDWKNTPPIPDQLSDVLPQSIEKHHALEKGEVSAIEPWKGMQPNAKLWVSTNVTPRVLVLLGWFLMGGSSCGILVWMSGICLKFWYENILFTTFWLNSITCFKMFLRKVLLDQCPISMIMDNEHGVFPKIHRHGRAQSNRVCADVILFMPSFTSTISHCVCQRVYHVGGCHLC